MGTYGCSGDPRSHPPRTPHADTAPGLVAEDVTVAVALEDR